MPTIFYPNRKKVMLASVIKIVFSIFFLIFLLIILELTAGLSSFSYILETFGIKLEGTYVLLWLILILFLASAFILMGIYLSIINSRYEFYDSKMIGYSNALLLFTNSRDVPYQNIVKVWYESKGFFNNMFNIGTIILDLSGMAEKDFRMSNMDSVQETVASVQQILRSYQLRAQAQYTERHKIDSMLEKGGL